MDQAKFTEKRENFFVGSQAFTNKQLQLRYVTANVVCFLSCFISVALFLAQKVGTQPTSIELILPVFFIFFGFLLLTVIINMHLAYKASAPIYRLMRYFKDVSTSQEVLPLSFRKKDYYQELPALVIEAFRRVQEKGREKTQLKKVS